jgi:selenocysteine lyase/cysteine desulfurase
MGQVRDLNLPRDLGPHIDFYLSNGHKWLYSPKGSAVLWVNSTIINSLFPEPTVISSANSVHDSPFAQRYEYVSTRDYTATISMSKALEFRKVQLGGEDAIYDYVRTLAISAKAHLLKFWQVDALVPDSMEEFMINIGLPKCISSIEQGKALQGWLLQEHNVYMLVLQGSDMFYTRLSAQVYLEMQDFERLGSLVLDFCQDWSITNDHAMGNRIVC